MRISHQNGLALTAVLPGLAAIAALALLGYSVYSRTLATPAMTGNSLSNVQLSQSADTDNQTANTVVASSEVAGWHLFGRQQTQARAAKAPVVAQQKRPLTKLSLKLVGILFSRDGQQDLAIISNGSSGEKTFRVGDEMFKLATLEEVHSDYVVLSRQGKFEELRIQRKGPDLSIETPTAVAPGRPQRLAQNNLAAMFLEHVDLEEQYSDSDQFEGLRFGAMDEHGRAMLNAAGIQDSDLLVRINNQLLAEDNVDRILSQAFLGSKPIRMGVQRAGKTRVINLPGAR